MLTNYTEAGLNQLIIDGVEENIHLDYKGGDALAKTDGKKTEISKDVSAFANSDGGQIVYGVKEFDDVPRRHLPERVDPIDRTLITKEWLEQVVNSKISPKVPDLRITPIDCANGAVYVVTIPRSTKAHQAADRRYYKRFNFESVPMEDYEINDIRGRQTVLLPLVNIDAEIRSSHMVYITVGNIGSVPAFDVSFTFPDNVRWIRADRATPSLFIHGAKIIPAGKNYRFMWNMAPTLFAADDPEVLRINATATYTHGFSGDRITDEFHIDLEAYRSGTTLKTDVEEFRDVVKEQVRNLTREIEKLNLLVGNLSSLAGSTGLDLSVPSLRNIKALFNSPGAIEKISAEGSSYAIFREILQIDNELADRLELHFSQSVPPTLEEVEGITPAIIEKINDSFYW